MDWLRLYAEFSTDPKVQMMSEAMQRRLIMLFCLQCSNGIETFHVTERETSIAFALRISDEEIALTKAEFVRRGFINEDWTLRNWGKRQYASDSSTARVRKHREAKKNAETKDGNDVKRFSNALEQIQNRTEEEQGGKPPLSPTAVDDDEAGEGESGSVIPQCPHAEILKLFAEKLPELPQPRRSLWAESKNAEALRARWRWVMTSLHESGPRKGQRLAETPAEGITWFGRFFEFVRSCPLLMGEKGDWHADLGWLVNKSNFVKVIQGNYQEAAA